MHSPMKSHLRLTFRVLRYLKNAPGCGITFKENGDNNFRVFVDFDWAKCKITRRSITGYNMFLGNNLVSWKSKKQSVVSRSSTEAEFRAMCNVCCEVIWIRKILTDLHVDTDLPIEMNCDNNPAIQILANPMLHERRSGGGRGVKEKSLNRNSIDTSSGIDVSTESDDNMNEDTPVGDTTAPEYFPPLTTPVTTTAGNAPGKSSYSNISGKPSGKKVNVRTLFTPGGNGIDMVVLVDSIRAISERFTDTAYGFFLGKKVAYPVVDNYVRNT
ncbi:ribonuclease H-like domain-containing protein [Tanacetum coccineum]